MTYRESQEILSSKLNIDFSDIANNPVFSLAELRIWINLATQRAWDFARWIFSEEAVFTRTTASEYYDYPVNFISDSIHILKIGEANKLKTCKKIRFEDYQKYRENYPNGKDLIFSDFKRFYFINPNIFSINENIEVWGKRRARKLVADNDLLPFSPDTDNEENSGNEAIVKLAYAMALSSDKKKDKRRAQVEEKEAYAILSIIANREQEEQVQYQVKDTPFLNVPRFF